MPAWLVGAFFLGLLVPVRLAAHQHISIAVPATRGPQVMPPHEGCAPSGIAHSSRCKAYAFITCQCHLGLFLELYSVKSERGDRPARKGPSFSFTSAVPSSKF